MAWGSEEWQFRLSYAGRSAGTGRWLFGHDGGDTHVIRAEYQFQGGLGNQKRVQVSRLAASTHLPTHYSETGERGNFETQFNATDGTVRLKQNNDVAEQALTRDYHDPLSLLQALRELSDDVQTWRADMVGGTVLVTRLPDQTITTQNTARLARVYYLRPGSAFVYLDAEAPHRVLRMEQNLGAFTLETSLGEVRQVSPQRIPSAGNTNNGRTTNNGRIVSRPSTKNLGAKNSGANNSGTNTRHNQNPNNNQTGSNAAGNDSRRSGFSRIKQQANQNNNQRNPNQANQNLASPNNQNETPNRQGRRRGRRRGKSNAGNNNG